MSGYGAEHKASLDAFSGPITDTADDELVAAPGDDTAGGASTRRYRLPMLGVG